MEYMVYRLRFFTGVHFGNGSLGTSGISVPADTLFSALCLEAAALYGPEGPGMLADAVREGKLRLSDLQPYLGDELYLPKPLRPVKKETDGNSIIKKSFAMQKETQYVIKPICSKYYMDSRLRERSDLWTMISEFLLFVVDTMETTKIQEAHHEKETTADPAGNGAV